MTFHPLAIFRLLGRTEKIFHELEKKLAERWLAKIDQQSWFRRMLCWQIFTGTLLLVQLRSLHFQGIKNRPVYFRSFAHSWIPSFPTALKASPFLHLHLQVFISAGLNRALLKRKDFSWEINIDSVRVFFPYWSALFSHFGPQFFPLTWNSLAFSSLAARRRFPHWKYELRETRL